MQQALAGYAEARVHLDDALNLLANCADIYARCDDANRRLCNQAFFTRIYLDEDDHNRELRVEHARPFDMLLHPGVQADATAWAGGGAPAAHEAQTRQRMDQAKV
jgi:site-specific DNA recombinase